VAADGRAWLAATRAAVLDALAAAGGEAAGADLARAVPALQVKVTVDEDKAWGRDVTLTSQLLNGLSADGAIVRGRPRGSWVSSQYRWAATDDWLPGGLPERPLLEARAELVRRYLTAFGPASVTDVRWWTGWMKGATTALAALDLVDVELDDGPGIALADDLAPTRRPQPWAALLPALDPTMMGWSERDWYLGEHRPALFDRSGNAGPTVWWEGRVVGGWAQRPAGDVVFRLLEDVGAEATAAVEAEAARVTALTDGVRPIPKFRTPLERELSA
ncbi:MAG: winged helix DNA-binding domain-containing protein, partial [Acidimicrobiia bacterium]|nr:winged helix DNA-binding domain-containing protein [Acidimicrobiia bacterium]